MLTNDLEHLLTSTRLS